MGANDSIFACRYAKHPTNSIEGITHAKINFPTVNVEDQGPATSGGREATALTHKRIEVELYGLNFASLLALVGVAPANCVIGIVGPSGVAEKITIKNVIFLTPIPSIEIPAKDSGGKLAPSGVRGEAIWAANDTYALMYVRASDAS